VSDIADLERVRASLLELRAVIVAPGTPSGARRRATRALADTALQACDIALALLREREAAAEELVP
jgi:hypothetical protein